MNKAQEILRILDYLVKPWSWYNTLYHYTSKAALEKIKQEGKIRVSKPTGKWATRHDVPGVYLTNLEEPSAVRNVLGNDIKTEVRIHIDTSNLDWDRFSYPKQDQWEEPRTGEREARNSITGMHEVVYLDDITLPENFEYVEF